jgi:hypothetical protein
MLAFDLETTGLSFERDEIMCASAYDPDRGLARAFLFARGDSPEEFMRLLDEAERLCCFNGVRFDIPFIRARWSPAPERVEAWRRKSHDVYEACRLCLGVTFSLNALLLLNGLESKSGSGLKAVELARSGQFDALGAYCLDDARLTHAVSSMPRIRLPKCERVDMTPLGAFVPRAE